MRYQEEIQEKIERLVDWQKFGLLATCVESVIPIIDCYAKPETKSIALTLNDALWSESLGFSCITADSRIQIEDLEESNCDYSHSPSYDVMMSLSIIAYSIDFRLEAKNDHLLNACIGAVDFFGGIDNILTQGNAAVIVDPLLLHIPKELERRHIGSQFRIIDIMETSTAVRSDVVTRVQEVAFDLAQVLKDNMATLASIRGWERP